MSRLVFYFLFSTVALAVQAGDASASFRATWTDAGCSESAGNGAGAGANTPSEQETEKLKVHQGIGFRGQAGAPLTNLGAHPVYDNEGEIPLGNGRGTLGRTASNMQLDLHTDYAIPVHEGMKVKLAWDMFNVLNSRSLTQVDQDSELNSTTPNVDYLKPLSFQRAFYARGSVRWEF